MDLCDIHSRSLDLYCSTDKQFICIECQFSSQHEGHKFELASRVSQKETSIITKSGVTEIDKAIENIESRRRQIIRQGKAVVKDIQEEINVIVNKKLDILEKQQKKAEAAKKKLNDSEVSLDIDLILFEPKEEADIKFIKQEHNSSNKCSYFGELKSSYSIASSPVIGGLDFIDTPLRGAIGPSPTKGELPVKIIPDFKYPWGLTTTGNGEVIIAENLGHRITILNRDGTKLRSFGTKGKKEGQFNHPYGVAISHDGHILVTDSHRLQKLTFDGEFVQLVGSGNRENGPLKFDSPKGIAVHPTTGQIFIADRDNDRIQVLYKDLTYSHSFGERGSQDEHFSDPCDALFDKDGYLFIVDSGHHCIKKFAADGEYVSKFASYGNEPGQLDRPSAITMDSNNNLLYIVEECSRVSVFDTSGAYKHRFGKFGKSDKDFKNPCGIAFDVFGTLYVSDSSNGRIVLY